MDKGRNLDATLLFIDFCDKVTKFLDLQTSKDELEQTEMEEQSEMYPPDLQFLAEEDLELLLPSLPTCLLILIL